METEKSFRVPILTKAFVLLTAFYILSYSLPDPPRIIVNGFASPTIFSGDWFLTENMRIRSFTFRPIEKGPDISPIQTPMIATGLWQSWDMYAPDPYKVDHWVDADVIYRDGTTKKYRLTRVADQPVLLKYFAERDRKYLERAVWEEFSWDWPYMAQRVATVNYKDTSNPPNTINLYLHQRRIPPFGQEIPQEYSVNKFYEYAVDQEKLKQAGPTR